MVDRTDHIATWSQILGKSRASIGHVAFLPVQMLELGKRTFSIVVKRVFSRCSLVLTLDLGKQSVSISL